MLNKILIPILIIAFSSGCSVKEFFTLGHTQSKCEEEGCDYRDAGVCDSPYNIIQNKSKANKLAYKDIQCGKVKND
jgi:hypothetical protein